MNAEKQHKGLQQADPIRSKREKAKLGFVDNRSNAIKQRILKDIIQKKTVIQRGIDEANNYWHNVMKKTGEVNYNLVFMNPEPGLIDAWNIGLTSRDGLYIDIRRSKLKIGDKLYDAEYIPNQSWVRFEKNGNYCWLYLGKCVSRVDQYPMLFQVYDYIIPYINNWMDGNLILYRGVDSGHVVFQDALRGIAPAKSNADLDIPGFTSDTSMTRYIPFSTSWDIAVMATKASSRDGSLLGRTIETDEEVGVVLRVQIGTNKSIGVFDTGEIQVLDPPEAFVTRIGGKSLQNGQRVDRKELDEDTILEYLSIRLNDTMWGNLGKGFIGWKKPNGIMAMQSLLEENRWKDILALAVTRGQDSHRHPATSEFYTSLINLQSRALAAGLI